MLNGIIYVRMPWFEARGCCDISILCFQHSSEAGIHQFDLLRSVSRVQLRHAG
jgi:hypothetical protein